MRRLTGLGYDARQLLKRQLSASVEEFYNKCHSPSDGRFCSGDSGVVKPIENFDGFFDPAGLADKDPAVVRAGAAAFDLVGRVVGFPADHPKVIVKMDDGEFLGEDEGSLGAYMPPEPGLDRGRLIFRAKGVRESEMTATIIHELGHHLSLGQGVQEFHDAMGGESEALSKWADAVAASPTVKDLVAARAGALKAGAVDTAGYADYLLMPEELFARSFAQYVAVKTGDRAVLGIMNEMLKDEASGGLSQWPPNEFEAVGSAMEEFLKERGLLR